MFPKPLGAVHVPALVGAALVSVLLRHMGFLGIFFLVPLGFAALFANGRTALGAAAAVFVLEGVLAAAGVVFGRENAAGMFSGAVYTALVMGIFIWIMTPGPVRIVRRLALGAAVITGFFLFIMFGASRGYDGFSALFRPQAELIASLYTAEPAGEFPEGAGEFPKDAGAYTESAAGHFPPGYNFTAERILGILRLFVLRGGALASSVLLLFISRRLSFFVARLARHRAPSEGVLRAESLVNFHAPPEAIWVLSFSLLGILLFRLLSFGPGETMAWNALSLSALVFLAQGGGIFFWFLAGKTRSPFMRILINVAIILVILSPGINAFALGLLVLLGIAENWAPLRAPGGSGSSPTPGM
ncbi:MAG: hypothetical protein LBG42_06815 [Treponema sp.]|nr:hypothetical protein [Treponema sp.]